MRWLIRKAWVSDAMVQLLEPTFILEILSDATVQYRYITSLQVFTSTVDWLHTTWPRSHCKKVNPKRLDSRVLYCTNAFLHYVWYFIIIIDDETPCTQDGETTFLTKLHHTQHTYTVLHYYTGFLQLRDTLLIHIVFVCVRVSQSLSH